MKEETAEDHNYHNHLDYGFDIGDEMMGTFGETEIWLAGSSEELIADHQNISLNDFPPILDFPCISSSSSSSSSSTPGLTHNNFVASSSWLSSTPLKPDHVEEKTQDSMVIVKSDVATPAPALSSTEGFQPSDCGGTQDVNYCMDVVENFGYMDLIEEVWDPSSTVFENHGVQQNPDLNHHQQIQENGRNEVVEERMMLKAIFFEWLKTNKENISVQQMRNIKLNKATVECASRSLGNTKEGKKQLVKLILQWVEQSLHHKKQIKKEPAASVASAAQMISREPAVVAAAPVSSTTSQVSCQYPFPNPNPNYNLMDSIDPNTCMMWIPTPYQSYVRPVAAATSSTSVSHPQGTFRQFAVSTPPNLPRFLPPTTAYMGGEHPYVSGANVAPLNFQPCTNPVQREYNMLDCVRFVSIPQYNSVNVKCSAPIEPKPIAPVYNGNGERGRLDASATKEARKNRMARKKRSPWFNYRHHKQKQHYKHDLQEQLDLENWTNDDGQTNCSNWIYESAGSYNNNGQTNCVNWVYWPAAVGVPMLLQPPVEAQLLQLECQPDDQTPPQPAQSNQLLVKSEGEEPKQGFRLERNLKFLLQKVLKQSDVGSHGRIVLPKKEAETQLPQLEARDGIIIPMEDMGTSNVWNLRYRFWPNNKSRMYVLENTGEFVKANGLQEGDFIVIYSDVKCGKYLIRGVKVRLPARAKAKAKGKAIAKRKAPSQNKIETLGVGNGHSSTPSNLQ